MHTVLILSDALRTAGIHKQGASSPKLGVFQTTNTITQGSYEAELAHNILQTQDLRGSYYPKTQKLCSPLLRTERIRSVVHLDI